MADDEGLEEEALSPEGQEEPESTRRSRPILAFMKRRREDNGEPEPEEVVEKEEMAFPPRVRPVRVLKTPLEVEEEGPNGMEAEAPFSEGPVEEEAPFAERETLFTEEPMEVETPFTEEPGEETPFTEEPGEETPFTEGPEEEETPFTEGPMEDETPFAEGPEEETPFTEEPGEETPFIEEPGEEEASFAEEPGEETPFAEEPMEDEASFTEEPMKDEASFAEEPEVAAPFTEETIEEGSPYSEMAEAATPLAEESIEEQPTFAETAGNDMEAPFAVAEEENDVTPFPPGEDGEPFAFSEVPVEKASIPEIDDLSYVFTEVGTDTIEPEQVPDVPFEAIEQADEGAIDDEGLGTQEEQEMTEDLQLRQEETPVRFEKGKPQSPGTAPTSPPFDTMTSKIRAIPIKPTEEAKPTYHKYLKPDQELLDKKLVRARPTGFDQDLETDAGEIDFGIDLVDPHERKKRPHSKVPRPDVRPAKGAVGGHDADGEVGSRELGNDIGVDYNRRRKRRL